MGCDIHLFAERKITPKWFEFWKKEKWVSIDKWSNNEDFPEYSTRKLHVDYDDRFYTGGRNYNLFCALAGVRHYHFDGDPKIISEPKGMPKDCCIEIVKECESWGSDGHSHSWLSSNELLNFDWSLYGNTCDRFRSEVIPKLLKYKNSRIVFWFDN